MVPAVLSALSEIIALSLTVSFLLHFQFAAELVVSQEDEERRWWRAECGE